MKWLIGIVVLIVMALFSYGAFTVSKEQDDNMDKMEGKKDAKVRL